MGKRNILLNPGPATTTDTVKKAQIVPDICPREEEFGDLMQDIRNDLVTIAGGDEDYTSVLFSGSGTAVMDSIISSVVPPNKKILIINNGAYGERLVKIAETYMIPLIELRFDWGAEINLDEVKTILEKENDISCIGVIHHETTTGILNPIKKIGKLAEFYDCTYMVDTISSFAGVPFNIKECNIDFMMSTSNKCIQAMAGVAFVICKNSSLEKIKKYPKRSFYLDLFSQYDYLEKRKQMRFTPPVQVMYALKQAIVEFFKEGAENRYSRYKKNYQTLLNGLTEKGFDIFLKDNITCSNLLVTINEPNHPNFDFRLFHDKLYKKGFTIYPGKIKDEKTFRIAVMGAINHKDIEHFLIALDEVLSDMKVDLL